MMKTDKNDKRILILQSAASQFSKKGYYKTTMEDIANSADIGKSTVYEYFSSKEQLFQSIIIEGCNYFLEFVNRQLEGVCGVKNKLHTIIYAWLFFVDVHYDLYLVLNNYIYDHSLKNLNEYMSNQFTQSTIAPICKMIEEGVAQGEIQVQDVKITAQMITGMIFSMIRYWIDNKQQDPADPCICSGTAEKIFADPSRLPVKKELQRIADILTQSILFGIKTEGYDQQQLAVN